ncbi:hypothetical protein BCE75_101302 [Isoptericola sp. CG 20/1183]|uniref:Uncharacterized protein n=1 Tax=Isoptericola halotolerans TaxID=300560 RepID=A0ABX5EGF5_9MICO|nr:MULTISPECIES: hypothetical protein [Isoptericola]PRZ08578.1 hypothetical protein BCL65_102120 [Isoptericola halotolerans]PRZ10975.1 hypothetical protein BCE75_101302 [Isoptericola sp. CG 20/1183]
MPGSRLLPVARGVAVAVSVPTFAYLFLRDNAHLGNPFFVPDVVLCAVLLVGASLPARAARPALTFGFVFAAGVVSTAVFDYVARDSFNGLTLIVAVACLVMGVLLIAAGTATTRSTTGGRRVSAAPRVARRSR